MSKITIMVPALNEEETLEDGVHRVIRSAERYNVELDVIIINDGSTDRTPEIATNLEKNYHFIQTVHNERNLGVGTSLVNSLKLVRGEKLLIISGDGDVGEDEISDLFSRMDKAEMVFLYYLNKEMRGRFRNALSSFYNVIHVIFFNMYVQYISGPCIYPVEKLKKLDLKSKRFSIVAELSVKLLCLGCTFYEVPGYMKRGKVGSSAISFNNLMDVIISFVRLFIDIKIISREVYNKTPVRVQ